MPRRVLPPPPPLSVRRPPWRRRLRILLWRARVPFAAVALGLAAAVAVGELRPAPPVTVDVLVAAHDVPAGTVLTDADVRTAAVPPDTAVAGAQATGHASVVGQRTAVPVPAGLPLVPGVLAGGRLAGPPGTVVAAVRLADGAVATLLQPGDRVDVLAASAQAGPGSAVARGALVLPAPAAQDRGSGLLGGSGEASASAPLMLAVQPEEAAALAGAAGTADLSAVVVP